MQASPRASVIVRTFNSAATLEACLDSIRSQTVPAEIIVVDSGSEDATLALASAEADRVIHLTQQEFSYGRALNVGAAAAGTTIHVALSSHCALPREDWLAIAADLLAEADARAACGLRSDASGAPLTGPFRADHDYVLSHRSWGFSNHASAWTAAAWDAHRFDETLTASEDKEWTWRALSAGGTLIADPRLIVEGDHRRSSGVRSYYARLVKEIVAIDALDPIPPFGVGAAVREWGRNPPRDPFMSRSRPFGRTRLVEVAARWSAGRRSAAPGTRDPRA